MVKPYIVEILTCVVNNIIITSIITCFETLVLKCELEAPSTVESTLASGNSSAHDYCLWALDAGAADTSAIMSNSQYPWSSGRALLPLLTSYEL